MLLKTERYTSEAPGMTRGGGGRPQRGVGDMSLKRRDRLNVLFAPYVAKCLFPERGTQYLIFLLSSLLSCLHTGIACYMSNSKTNNPATCWNTIKYEDTA